MKKTVTIILAAALCLVLLSGCTVRLSIGYDNADKYTMGAATMTDEITAVDIGWVSGEVNISYHEGNTVEFSETANMDLNAEDTMYYWLDGKTLRINFAKSGFVNIENLQKTLTVYLPAELKLESLEVDSVSSDVIIDDIQTVETEISTVSGEVEANNLIATDELSFGTVSGDVEANVTGSLKKLKVNTVSGRADVSAEALEEFSFDTTSGDVSLSCGGVPVSGSLDSVSGALTLSLDKTALETSGFTARLDTVSGNFKSEIPTTLDGKKYICGNGSADYDLETVSGDIKMRYAEVKAPADATAAPTV